MNYRPVVVLSLVAGLLVSAGCGKSAPPAPVVPPAAAAGPQWHTFVDRFIEDSFLANPFFAVDQGRHDFDGQAPNWSREGLEKEVARLRAARTHG